MLSRYFKASHLAQDPTVRLRLATRLFRRTLMWLVWVLVASEDAAIRVQPELPRFGREIVFIAPCIGG